MSNRKLFWLATLLLAALALSACSGLIPRSGEEPTYNEATQQAAIVKAVESTATAMAMQAEIDRLQTQVAAGTAAAVTPAPTHTLPPMGTPTNTPTGIPTVTLAPSATATLPPTPTAVIPTATVVIVQPSPLPPTPTPIPCNAAQFVKDVTIPDGSTLTAGSNFTKTWQIRNVGSCTWTTAYDIVFSGGDQMGAPSAVDLPGSVAPGQVIDISIGMTAPTAAGSYRGNWKLRDAYGSVFGLGRSNSSFYVDIRVAASSSSSGGGSLDMVAAMCTAEWTSGAGTLSCPGADNDSRGFVFRVDKPTLETGYVDDEPALLTHPQMVTDGSIRGKYPSLRVESGSKFTTIVGCARNTTGCDVRFQLDYQIGSGPIQTLAAWREAYEEQYTQVSVDLSSLAGQDVRFILTVLSNGSPDKDRALWLAPKIGK